MIQQLIETEETEFKRVLQFSNDSFRLHKIESYIAAKCYRDCKFAKSVDLQLFTELFHKDFFIICLRNVSNERSNAYKSYAFDNKQ